MLPNEIVTGSLLISPGKVLVFGGASQKSEKVNDWNDGLKTPFAGEKFSNSLVSIKLKEDLRELSAERSFTILF